MGQKKKQNYLVSLLLLFLGSTLWAGSQKAETYLIWTSSFGGLSGLSTFKSQGWSWNEQPLLITKAYVPPNFSTNCAIVEIDVTMGRAVINNAVSTGKILHLWDVSVVNNIENGGQVSYATREDFNPIPDACFTVSKSS